MSKLTRYCEGVMEATWLTAVVCIPLFFSAWGEAIQSEKNYLLRSLAILVLTAWIIKTISQTRLGKTAPGFSEFRFAALFMTPLAAPAAILALAWIAATLLSLSPWDSFWGVYFVRDGTYTSLSCLLFFASLVASIRSEQQIHRVVTAAILTSIPISLYGIGQRFGIEPVVVTHGRDLLRVGSTLGNPVHLGAYLIMILPLTFSRVLLCCWTFRSESDHRIIRLVQSVVYGLITALQFLAIVFTVSRGPILGLIVSSCVMFLILAIYRRGRWMVFAIVGTGIVLLTGLILLAHPNGPFRNLADRPDLKRFVDILNPQRGSSGRTEIWREAAQAARFGKVVETADGSKDRFSELRFLFGYGPESVASVSRLYRSRDYNLAMAEVAFLDRFHNDFWDTLITTGALGTIAYLALTMLVVYYGCKWLGLISSRGQYAVFWWLYLGGGLSGSLGLISWQGVGFLGVGLRLGSLMGLTAFLIWASRRGGFDSQMRAVPIGQALTLIGLFSGVLAHLTEIGFSFTIETTLFYFWMHLALMLGIGHRLPATKPKVIASGPVGESGLSRLANHSSHFEKAEPIVPFGSGQIAYSVSWQCSNWCSEIAGGLLVALVLANLGFMLIRSSETTSTIRTIMDALTRLPGNNNAFTWSLLWSLVAIVTLSAFTLTNESPERPPSRIRLHSFGLTILIAGAIALTYWFVLARHTALMALPSEATLATLDQFIRDHTFVIHFHYGFTLLLILLLAGFVSDGLSGGTDSPGRSFRFAGWTGAVIALASISTICSTNLKWSKVGVVDNLAGYFITRAEQWPMVAALSEAAINAVPAADNHHLTLGKAFIELAAVIKDPDEKRVLFLKAATALEAGLRLRPLNPAFLIEHGNLYLKWALGEQAIERRTSLGKKALTFYQLAAALDPGDFDLWNKRAYVEMVLLGSLDEAHQSMQRSVDLYPNWHKTSCLLGDVLSQKGLHSTNSGVQAAFFRAAATNYHHAYELAGTNSDVTSFRYLYASSLGKSHVRLREWSQAVAAYRLALPVCPPAERWRNEETLARLFADLKDKTNATEHLRRALEVAPADQRAGLIALRNKILATL